MATFVLASGLVSAIVASAAIFALLNRGMRSGVTLAQDMAEIEKLHRYVFDLGNVRDKHRYS
ncbi:MAG TPA: hypothetical protein VJS64_03130 [Pyrinomonadaceae bacterium]|nr:hypothetical protein [Pyrinomonadaceae bacterium]